MGKKGLLVDYYWCTGCHSCEVACQMEHGLPVGQYGIKVSQIGPWQYGEKDWEYTFTPALTTQCDFCAGRQAKGKLPSCVQHCQAKCIEIVDEQDAVEKMKGKRKALFMTK